MASRRWGLTIAAIPGQGFEPRFYGPEPHVLPVGRPRSDRRKIMPIIEAQDAKRPTTIMPQVGYNEVVGVRQVGKSTACVSCPFLDNLCASSIASLFLSTVAGGCCQLSGVPTRTCPKYPQPDLPERVFCMTSKPHTYGMAHDTNLKGCQQAIPLVYVMFSGFRKIK